MESQYPGVYRHKGAWVARLYADGAARYLGRFDTQEEAHSAREYAKANPITWSAKRPRLPVAGQPRTRGECASVPRPCPFNQCRYHIGAPQASIRPRGPKKHLSPVQEREVVQARANGEGVADLADRFGVSKRTIYNTLNGASRTSEMRRSCALDVADEGEHTQEEVAAAMGVTRQRVNQIEADAMRKLRIALKNGLSCKPIAQSDLYDYFADGPEGHTEPDHSGYDYGEDE